MRIKNVTRCIAKDAELEITGARLLTIEEARELPDRLRKRSYWWWLQFPGRDSGHVAYVYYDGRISNYGADVDNYYGGVRPVLKIANLRSSDLKIGDVFEFDEYKFEIISDKLAFCLDGITSMPFGKDWRAPDACNYNTSDVKKYIDEWFEKSRRESKQ